MVLRRKERKQLQGSAGQGDGLWSSLFYKKIICSSVMYSHRMPFHKTRDPPKTHLILVANLVLFSVVVDDDEEIED
jgi:hypothetical protein